MKITLQVLIILPGLMISKAIVAQSELDVELGLTGGAEKNIFKSPETLLDPASMEPLPQDSLIYTDMFFDVEYDIEYRKESKRSVLELGSDLWYRKYIRFPDLDQARLSATTSYMFNFSEKFGMGAAYDFLWSNRIGTSVTGDLLMRSFKYFGHQGSYFLFLQPKKAISMQLTGEYQYKNYYDERTTDPLDHRNVEIQYELDYEINREQELSMELSWTDRNYYKYRALDLTGHYDPLNPTREFTYYKSGFDYNWSPIRGLRINPGVEFVRRLDQYEDYYSYTGYGASMRLRYYTDKFYVSLFGDIVRQNYDIREAFSSMTENPTLFYNYYDFQFIFRYTLSERWEASIKLESDNRASNSDLEYFKTRRPYHNYEAMIGINYIFPEMKWK